MSSPASTVKAPSLSSEKGEKRKNDETKENRYMKKYKESKNAFNTINKDLEDEVHGRRLVNAPSNDNQLVTSSN